MRMIDLTGKRFGRLTVINRHPTETNGTVMWKCLCDCGNYTNVSRGNLRNNFIVSCGCYRKEMNLTHGHSRRGKQSKEYWIWSTMIQRCTNPKNKEFEDYGGRGIKVCDRWQTFDNFIVDMGSRPSNKHSIERVDVNGNYEPSNCIWATADVQSRNRRLFKKNKSGCPGVSWKPRINKWQSGIKVDGKQIYLGVFEDREEAIRCRKEAETKYHEKKSS